MTLSGRSGTRQPMVYREAQMTAAARHSLRRREEGVSLSLCRVAACAVCAGQLNCFVRRRFFFWGGGVGWLGIQYRKMLIFSTPFGLWDVFSLFILDPDPGSGSDFFPPRIQIVSILDPGSASKIARFVPNMGTLWYSFQYGDFAYARIRIILETKRNSVADTDPVPFWPLDPGTGIDFFRIPDPNPICLRAKWQFFE